MTIKNSTTQDLKNIFTLYDYARKFQKIKGAVLWPEFNDSLIESEIAHNQQWKIVIDDQIACIWSSTFNDPEIWLERNADPAVYIHRIATNPAFRGRNLVNAIVVWAKGYARENGKKFVRIDTVGENKGLIDYYQKCGFDFLGLVQLEHTDGLPAHYHHAKVSLFQIEL
jgi:ribosomal protein S18 acetylase RimI-like enzyme